MEALHRLLYVGSDEDFYNSLAGNVKACRCCLSMLNDPQRLMPCLRLTPVLDQSDNNLELLETRFRQRYAAVIFDLDLPYDELSKILKKLHTFDASISAIVLSNTCGAVSKYLAHLDGAAGYFIKPINDFKPILDMIEQSLQKQRHWETIVRKLASGNSEPHDSVLEPRGPLDEIPSSGGRRSSTLEAFSGNLVGRAQQGLQ